MDSATEALLETIRAKLRAYLTGRTAGGQAHPIRSLRRLARELEMSPSGLAKFIDGAAPYSATLRSVTEWYRLEVSGSRAESIAYAVDALARLYPPRHREDVRSRLIEVTREMDTAYPPEPDALPVEPDVSGPLEHCDNCGMSFPQSEIRRHRRREHSVW